MCRDCGRWSQINRIAKIDNNKLALLHLCGVSYRSIADSFNISPATAYRKCHKVLESLPHIADITRDYCSRFCGILLVDGKYIKVKGYERKIPVIYGVDYLTHDIPTYKLSISENYQTCSSFFASLRLLNYPLQALVSDDNTNIYEACKSIYPKSITQLCLNHYKESIRKTLEVRTDETYREFMQEVEYLFAKKRSSEEFNTVAGRIYYKYKKDPIASGVMTDIQKRISMLIAYTNVKRVPKTTNLIESFNSHLEGRLKTIKGFENFHHANLWLNAYFLKRRTKPFTDCTRSFRHLNGKSSIQLTCTKDDNLEYLLKLIR